MRNRKPGFCDFFIQILIEEDTRKAGLSNYLYDVFGNLYNDPPRATGVRSKEAIGQFIRATSLSNPLGKNSMMLWGIRTGPLEQQRTGAPLKAIASGNVDPFYTAG
jgi:hypothetical protein